MLRSPALKRAMLAMALFVGLAGLTPDSDRDPLTTAAKQCFSRKGDVETLARACSVAIDSRRLVPRAAAWAHTIRAGALLGMGQRRASLADLDAAVALDPNLASAHYLRARVLSGERQHERELLDWNAVVRLEPNSADALHHRADTLDSMGRHDEAIADYTRAIGLRPDASLYVDRGVAYAGKKDDEHALADFAEAIRLDPKEADAYKSRGEMRFARADFAAAVPDFEAAIKLRSVDHYAVLWLYLAERRAGHDGAAELAHNAMSLDLEKWPGPVVRLFLGQISPEQITPDPDPVPLRNMGNLCEARFYKGEYYLLRGDRERAKAAFHAAIDTGSIGYIEYHQAEIELEQLSR